MDIDINKILNAASTKWNFIKFQPGLVGGHCIGVDPYYLTYKSKQLQYNPKVILSGRKINDSMGFYVAKKLTSFFKKKRKKLFKSKILVLGVAFKENCSDMRNSRIFDTINYLKKKGANVDVYDPLVPINFLKRKTKKYLVNLNTKNFYDAIIISVAHNEFSSMGIKKIKSMLKKDGLIFDLKSIFSKKETDWQL